MSLICRLLLLLIDTLVELRIVVRTFLRRIQIGLLQIVLNVLEPRLRRKFMHDSICHGWVLGQMLIEVVLVVVG